MELQSHSEPDSGLVSTKNLIGSTPYHGAFFPNARGFAIHGGEFTIHNDIRNSTQELAGDIILIKEIRWSGGCGVVGPEKQGAKLRRIYTAEVDHRSGRMAVAIYQGDGAEEQWREHIAKYESIRHPNIMQLYGLVSATGLHAMVFHDDLIAYEQFLSRFQHSPILTLYIKGYCCTEWNDVLTYLRSTQKTDYLREGTVWIRRTTGGLCVDLAPGEVGPGLGPMWKRDVIRLEDVSLDDPNAEAVIIPTIDEDEYHDLCALGAHMRSLTVSTRHLICRGLTIFRSNPQHHTLSKITESLDISVSSHHDEWLIFQDSGEVMDNSWIRYDSRRARYRNLTVWARHPYERAYTTWKFWVSQANYIFAQLQGTSPVENVEDYVYVHQISFTLKFLPNSDNPHEPAGYLFICPPEDLRTGANLFQWPDCPAYWSFDPSGTIRLSTEDARIFGFPIIHIETILHGHSWDRSVYEGLRRFHQGKGFDPESQDLARRLGYPLFELSTKVGTALPSAAGGDSEPLHYCEENSELCFKLGHYLDKRG
ncbi:hypothetical protein MSAN_01524500 [Mycena sanguinolenta]|uniref:Protein kinase domain-containing protein n=1 Tax=Mycena sanguinolenta TaxID=230812 RepID=A0A8H6Y7P1_9AGAR|nr:hypothetical protein MSAN_01524500 [Mycena sanguinolenta]